MFLGSCKIFFFRKHAYNFFFNYEFNSFLERIFNFFSLALLKFYSQYGFYFYVLFDDLYSNFNIVFFTNNYFNVDLSSVKTANYFFNKVIIYNY
jgi:hypothetical protein